MTIAKYVALAFLVVFFLLSVLNVYQFHKTPKKYSKEEANSAVTSPVITGWLLGFGLLYSRPQFNLAFTALMALILYVVCGRRKA